MKKYTLSLLLLGRLPGASHAKRAFLLLCGLSLAGCAHTYTPKASRPLDPIPEFRVTGEIALKNGQASNDKVVFLKNGAHQWTADRQAWTDTAIEISKRELQLRGLLVGVNAKKFITLSVDSVKTEVGWVKIDSTIVMTAKTADGYSATYTGRNNSAMVANLERQWDGVVMRAVAEMLKDPQIIQYLKK